MCFSAEASFAAGAVLIPAGVYCLHAAARKKISWLPLAAIPVVFGLQQVSEGVVWLGLERGDAALTRSASLLYLFFALSFWPFWISFQAAVGEVDPVRRRIIALLTIANTVWFWILFYPLATGPESLLQTQVVHHSIQYSYPDLAVYEVVSQPLLRVLYLLSMAFPLGIASGSWGRLPGLGLAGSAVIAAVIFSHAFVSVWCFFGALLSAYLCVVFRSLPAPGTENAPVSEPRESYASRNPLRHA